MKSLLSRASACKALQLASFQHFTSGWLDGYDGVDPRQISGNQADYDAGWMNGASVKESESTRSEPPPGMSVWNPAGSATDLWYAGFTPAYVRWSTDNLIEPQPTRKAAIAEAWLYYDARNKRETT